jgi:3-hydroxybutyryl-CoA dehydrogenase
MKIEMWEALDPIVKQEALFATNTSSLPVISQAAVTGRPEHFIGLHFFNRRPSSTRRTRRASS